MTDPVILINAFEVPAADAGAFVAAWQNARDYLREQPGYIDTVLHQSITPDAEFQFVNIAHWQTAEDFIAAAQSPGFRESAAGLAGYRLHPALYRPMCT
jgi:heme-degrading monooxygenase HmoA